MACNKMPAADGFAHDFGTTVNKISDGEECCLDVVSVKISEHGRCSRMNRRRRSDKYILRRRCWAAKKAAALQHLWEKVLPLNSVPKLRPGLRSEPARLHPLQERLLRAYSERASPPNRVCLKHSASGGRAADVNDAPAAASGRAARSEENCCRKQQSADNFL